MKKTVVLGICFILGMEVMALTQHDRRIVLVVSGVGLALVLLSLRRALDGGPELVDDTDADDLDLGESLRRWLLTTETTIRWSESSRVDWDRRLRPMLARRYELATGQRQSVDVTAYHATGQMLFGAELWQWVNPNNVTRSGDRQQPGPGRAALEEILRRLEQV